VKNKLLVSIISILCITTNLFAQTNSPQSVPGGMLFQAVAKDDNNVAAANRDVYAIVTILKNDSTGPIEYAEKFKVTSGDDGIFTLIIGKGNFYNGSKTSLYDIDWSTGVYFLNMKIAVSPSVGSNLNATWSADASYRNIGTSQLWTVPYSFYSGKAAYADGALKLLNTLPSEMGGTGVANPVGKKLTLDRSLSVKGAGDFTITTTGASNITFPTTGTMATLDGVEVFTNKTFTSPILTGIPTASTALITDSSSQIANTDFVQSNISLVKKYIDQNIGSNATPDATTLTKGKIQLTGDLGGTASLPVVNSFGGVSSSTISLLPSAVASNTASITANTAILDNASANLVPNTLVKRDGLGNFSANVITATLSGNSSTTSKLLNPVSIYGNTFSGTESITTVLSPNFGGTGIDNGINTIKLGGNLTTASDLSFAGTNSVTVRTTGITDITLPLSGTLSTLNGVESLSNKTLNGVKPESLATGFKISGGTSTSTTLTVIGDVTVGGVNTGDQLITLTGDVSGSGTGLINTTINSIGGVSSSTISELPYALNQNTINIAANTASITSNTVSIASEITRATNAEGILESKISSNTASITTNTQDIASNTASITSNTASIAAEITRATNAETALDNKIISNTASITTNTENIASNTASITSNAASIAAEVTRATGVEIILDNKISSNTASITTNAQNIASNTASITSNAASIAAEITRATGVETILDNKISSNTASITTNTQDIASNTASIAAETTRATNAETALDNKIISNTASITTNTENIASNTASITTNALNIASNTASITSNAASIAAEITRATGVETILDNKISSNTASITTNAQNIASNTASITTNALNIASNTASITSNAASIAAETTRATNTETALDNKIISNTASITTNTQNIASNTASITTNAQNIASNTASITSNAASIASEITRATSAETALDNKIISNTASITTNTQNIASNTASITTNTQNIASNTASITTNTQDIASNTASITAEIARAKAAEGVLDSKIVSNTLDIASNTASITTNTQNIASNTASITTNTQNIASNTASITSNTQNIASNTASITAEIARAKAAEGVIDSKIVLNTLDIASNTASITTNAQNIASNTASITSNTASIAAETTRATNAETELENKIISNTASITTNAQNIASNTVSITSNATSIAAEITRATGVETILDNKISSNTASITTNTQDIASNTASITAEIARAKAAEGVLDNKIVSNTLDIASNTASITTNTQDIASNTASITAEIARAKTAEGVLDSKIVSNTLDIASNTASITTNTQNIASNTASITTNTENIASNTASITTNALNIASNTASITSNTASIFAETTRATGVETILDNKISSNTASITTNAQNIASNTASITAEISRAKAAEGVLDSKIVSNTLDIASNTASITTNTQNIASNTASITTNAQNIASNTASITTNTQDIASNTASITTNALNIASNTASITSNTASIAAETTRATNAETALDNKIISNTASITTNTENIASNTASITTNTQNIASNTASITSNTAVLNSATNLNIVNTLIKRDGVTGGFEAGAASLISAQIGSDLVVEGNTKTGSLSSTITNAGELTAGTSILGTTTVNGALSAGETTVTNATISGISSITSLTGSKIVLVDVNNTLRTLDILDEEHGGTGSKGKNFVDLTTDQIVSGNKSFSGNIIAGTLSTTTDVNVGRDLKVNGKTSLGETTVTSINKVAFVAPLNSATLNIADGKTLNVSNDATVSGSNSGDQSISITGDITAAASTGILNAAIGAGKVLATHLANNAVTVNKIASSAVTNPKIAASAVTGAKIANLTITDNKLTTITTAGKVANSATTASSIKSNNTIVARDANGAFAATLITSDLIGNVTGDITGNAENVRAIVLSDHGGTGVNNAGKKITLGGDITTASDITFAGTNSTTIATQGVTNVLLPTQGTLATLSEKETLKNKTIENVELSGVPIAPTPALGTNTQQVATTAFVLNSVNTSTTSAVTSITSDLALKEDIANKVKSADFLNISNIDDAKYPTTKAVADFVLSGDLIGLNGIPSVKAVGGYSSQVISSVVSNVLSATSNNENSQIVSRDASGNFIANQITATLLGNSTNVNGIVLGENGGTGLDNRGKTIKLGGNLLTIGDVTFAGTNTSTISTIINIDGNTNVTLPTTGTLATLSEKEVLTNKTIESVELTGLPIAPTPIDNKNIKQVATVEYVLSNISSTTNSAVSSITSDLTKKEDKSNKTTSANFLNNLNEDNYPSTQAVNDFVLSGDLTPDSKGLPKVNTVGGFSSNIISSVVSSVLSATSKNDNLQLVQRDVNGNFSAGTIFANVNGNLTGNVIGNLDGNAKTATSLQNPVSIYGNIFSGTESITTVLAPNYGGTGFDNGTKTISLGGNILTAGSLTTSGTSSATTHDINLIVSDNTNITLPTNGTVATLAGTESLTNKTIDFSILTTNTKAVTQADGDKSDNIATTAFVQSLLSGVISSTVNNVSSDLTKKEDISNKVKSGTFLGTNIDDIKYPTTKAVNDLVISGDLVIDNNGKLNVSKVGGVDANTITSITTDVLSATSSNTALQIIKRDALGNFDAGTITAKLTGDVVGNVTGNLTGNVRGDVTGNLFGNANTATQLLNGRKIYGNTFNGTQDLNQVIGTEFGGTGVSSATANFVFAGPESGSSAAAPSFRKLVAADLPAGSGNYIANGTTTQLDANFNIAGAGVIGTSLTAGTISSTGNTSIGGNLEIAGNTNFNGIINVKGKSVTVNDNAIISGSNTGDQFISIIGDITANTSTGVLSATINNESVSYAKIQKVKAARLLGNPLSDLSSVAEIEVGSGLSLSNDGKLTASGLGGTVTNVSFNVNELGTDIAGSVSYSNTTPQIILSVPSASANSRGLITSADWSTFNGKQAALKIGSGIKIDTDNTISVTGLTKLNIADNAGILNTQLANNTIQLGATTIELGASSNSLSGLNSITTTNLTATNINGTSLIAGTISSTGNTSLGGSLEIAGNTNLNGNLNVKGKSITVNDNAIISGSNTGDQSISITGDITANASTGVLSATINNESVTTNKLANASVTYSKIQNVGAGKLLGNKNTSDASVGEISIGSGLNLDIDGKLSATGLGGTVTNVSFAVDNIGTDISGSVTNNNSSPQIKLSVPNASANSRGLITSADWNTFNDKQALLKIGSGIAIDNNVISATGLTATNLSSSAGILNTQLAHNTIQLGATVIDLGATANTISGLASVTATNFIGELTGNASSATKLFTERKIYGNNFNGTQDLDQVIASEFGGTGVNNSGKTITLGGNISTAGALSFIGANNTILNTTGATNLILPTTGTLATLEGVEAFKNKTINGITPTSQAKGFTISGGTDSKTLTILEHTTLKGDNTGDQTIVLTGDITGSGTGTFSTTISNAAVNNSKLADGSVNDRVLAGEISDAKLSTITSAGKIANSATTATSENILNSIVSRDVSGNFIAGTITASLNGNARTATNLQSPVSIYGNTFSGTESITTVLSPIYGGTGVNNGDKKITLGGNISTEGDLKLNGANTLTIATLGSTNITLPTTGTIATLAGTETMTNKTLVDVSLTGIPTAPTPLENGSEFQVANKAFVAASIASVTGAAVTNLSNTTQTALSDKEDKVNKVNSIITKSGVYNDLQYPTVNSIRSYVDLTVGGSVTPEATATEFGKIKLAGDLTGTASAPIINTVGGINASTIAQVVGKVENATSANFVFAGPANGSNAAPAFRKLVAEDIPAGSNFYIANATTLQSGASFNIGGSGEVGSLKVNGKTVTVSDNAIISGSNTGDQNISIRGDITANASTGVLSATINDFAITNNKLAESTIGYSKIQKVTAGKLLGNKLTTDASVGEITIGSGLSLGTDGILSANGLGGTVTNVLFDFTNTGTLFNASVTNSTTTPQISLNIPYATATNNGLINSTDWNTFNNKQGAISFTTNGSNGAATFTNNALNIPTYTLAGLGGIAKKNPITAGTKQLVSFDADGLVSEGFAATTDNINPAGDRLYVTAAQSGVLSNTSGINTGDQTISVTGDISAAGSKGELSASINNGAVTFAKIQNVSAARLLGNPTASSAITSEILLGTGLSFNGQTLNATGGTITEVKKLNITNTGNDISSSVTNGTIIPELTLNIPTASTTASKGLLSNTDFDKFSAKQDALTTTQLGVFSNTTGINTGDQRISINGDITANASTGVLSATINDLAITNSKIAESAVGYSKIQKVNASRLLGNPLASPSDVSEIQIGTGLNLSTNGILTANGSGGTVTGLSFNVTNDNSIGTSVIGSVTASSTTPQINLNIPNATATNNGLITSADWNTFNNKQNTISLTNTGNNGTATLTNNTLNIPTYTLAGLGGIAKKTAITAGTKQLVSFDVDGLVTAGFEATTTNINPIGDRLYVTAAQAGVLSNTSGTNTGDQNISITGDITANASTGVLSATINNGSITTNKLSNANVTFEKIQNITAGRLLGNKSNTNGMVGEIELGNGIAFDVNGKLSATGTGGTVTSLNPITINAAGNTFSSSVTNATSSPVLGLTIPLASATGTDAGLLSNADYSTFSAKQNAITAGSGVVLSGNTISVAGITSSNIDNNAGITNTQLLHNTIQLGSTSIALGATTNTLAGLASVTATNFVGDLTGNATNVTGVVLGANGGTGHNNGSNTIILGGNLNTSGTFTTQGGSALTLLTSGVTNITLPTSGTIATLTGSETFSNKTFVSPILNGTPTAPTPSHGDNSTNIATTAFVTAAMSSTVTDATTLSKGIIKLDNDLGGTADLPQVIKVGGVTATQIANAVGKTENSTSNNTINTLVARDGSGNFSAGTITATLNGNATNVSGIVAGANGGTGHNNGSNTIILGGNVLTAGSLTTAGAYSLTFLTTGNTDITLPTSGTIATLASPNFTGTPTSPTPLIGDNSTTIATTAFVTTAISAVNSSTSTSLAAKQDAIQEVSDETGVNGISVTTLSQTVFTLSQIPSPKSKVKMYINGIRISNKAYTWSGTTLTYTPSSNGNYAIQVNDRVQFDYFY
jgi:hypothetical protein